MSTLALLVCAAAAPQLAWGVNVARFNRSPRAKVALEAARQYAKAGRVGKAANWAERAAWCPDATAATRASVAKLQAQLKWRLRDAGFGVVEVSVAPAGTSLSVDGQLFLPKRPLYRLFLPKGSHQLQVAKDQFHTYRSIITAKPGEVRPMRVKLEYAVRPRVRFLVKPVTAEIWRAQDFLGFSSKVEFELPPGKNLIEVRAPGYTSWVHTLDLRAGDKRTIKVFLDKAVSRGRSRPAASNVRRKLTPLELANRGERHRLGRRPIDRNGRRRAYRGSGAAPEPMKQKKPDWKSVTPKGGAGPAPDDSDAPPPEPMGDDGDDGGGDTGGDVGGDDGGDVGGDSGGADTGVSAGGSLSNAAKGWIYGGLGLALMAGGAGMAVYGVGEANYANSLSLGHEDYDQYYDFAANLTYAGYGAAGIGAASLVVGGIYLFSKGGLSRRGKGLFLLGAGAATGLLGGYLVFDALQTANAANKLPIRHHAYERDFDGAESNWRAGVIAGGVGGAVALVGVWLALTGGDSGDEEDEANASPSWWERTTIIPSVAPGRASVTLTW